MITIAALRAAGLSADEIVRIVEAAENQKRERRREQNRVNQRKHRQHVSADTISHQVSDDGADMMTGHIEKKDKKEESKKRKKVSIPENWLPNEKGIELAKQQGFGEEKIKLEIHRFKDYAQQHNRQYADWDAAWRNWVTSPFQKGNGNGSGRQLQDDRLSVSKAAEKLAETPGLEFPARPSLVSGTSTPHRRLLPER